MEGKGRYHLASVDNVDYSTNSYELFILYLKLFNYPEYQRIMYRKIYSRSSSITEPCFPADHQSFLKAREQELRIYRCGYIPILQKIQDKHGKVWVKTRWFYHPEKAAAKVERIKRLNKPLMVEVNRI